jgi:virulence factor Mce-like protein
MKTRAAATLAFLLMTSCSAIGLGEQKDETITITADVEQAPNLFEGGRVTVRGIEVGKISDVEPKETHVTLTLEVDSEVAVPAGATLQVIPITVIADRYAQLSPAYTGGPTMEDGDHIPLSDTAIPAELDEVVTQLQGLLEAIEPRNGKKGPLSKLITNLNDSFEGRGDDLGGALDKSAAVLDNLANSDAEIAGLIRNLDRLFVALADRSSEIGILNERFRLVARSLLQDQANLEGTIEDVAFLSDETAGLFEDSGDDLGVAFRRLNRVVDELLTHQDALTETMQWTNVIAQALGAVDSSGKGLYAYSGRQVSPGSPGSEYNYRLEQRDTIACERIEAVYGTIIVFEPDAGPDAVVTTLNNYIPKVYQDDLHFLLKELVNLCIPAFSGNPQTEQEETSPAERKLLRKAAKVLGQKKLERFLARWYFEGRST